MKNGTDKEKAIQWAYNLLQRGTAAIVDTETTGLGKDDEIIEISAIDLKGKTLFNERVKPRKTHFPAATKIHGIKYEELKGCRSFDMVFLDFLREIENRDLVIYNAIYDLGMIHKSFKALGINLLPHWTMPGGAMLFINSGLVHCAMVQYAAYIGEPGLFEGQYKWQKLRGDHTALGDCKAVLENIKTMASEYND